MVKKIGAGGSAEVWLAIKDGKQFAVKIFNNCDTMEEAEFYVLNEMYFGKKISSQYVVSPHELFASKSPVNSKTYLSISFDYAVNGDLFSLLEQGRLPLPIAKFYAL